MRVLFFFHIVVTQRRRANKIHLLKDHSEKVLDNRDSLSYHIVEFYTNLLGTKVGCCGIDHRVIARGVIVG